MEYTPLNCAQYALLEAVLNTLVVVRSTMQYADLAVILGFNTPRDPKLHTLLGWSMEHDHGLGRPLRCSLIVRKDSGHPGDQYWEHARKIGVPIVAGGEVAFHDAELKKLGL